VRSSAVESRFHCVRPQTNRPKLTREYGAGGADMTGVAFRARAASTGDIWLTALSSSTMNGAYLSLGFGASGGTVGLGASCGSLRARTLMRYALMNQSCAEIVSESGAGSMVPISALTRYGTHRDALLPSVTSRAPGLQ
jgi:hypothetical protein